MSRDPHIVSAVLASRLHVCVDVLAEDSANYTCQVDGPLNTVIGTVTHSVLVNGLSAALQCV